MLFSDSESQFPWRAQIGMGSSSPATDLHLIIQMIYIDYISPSWQWIVDTMQTGSWYNKHMEENIQ